MKTVVAILSLFLLLADIEAKGQASANASDREGNIDRINMHLPLFLGSVDETNSSELTPMRDFQAFVEKLETKRDQIKSDQRFFNYLFYKIHRKYLKLYQIHTSVEDILERGIYDCVSGTAFYALILDYLGIDYEIKEFDFHVLMVARSNNQQFLIESTDPVGGLTSNPKEIAFRIKQYITVEDTTTNIHRVGSNDRLRQYSLATNKNISLIELAGLLQFNNAVYYYNQKKPFETVASLQKALALYDSKRIRAFRQLVARSFLGDPDLTQIQKEKLLDRLGLEFVALK